jgi:hypothetical protein
MNVVRRIYDERGVMVGVMRVDEEIIPNVYTNVDRPCVAWNEVTARKEVVGIIAWDGACHSQITGWYDSRSPGGPRGKITGMYLKGGRPWMIENDRENRTDALIKAHEKSAGG